jgi:flagellar biosynthesis protein FlhG
VISVTSGKGGVGKTVCVANMAVIMAGQGYRVLVIDADLGLANIDLHFGLNPKFNLNHFFAGEKKLQEILVEAKERSLFFLQVQAFRNTLIWFLIKRST